MPANQQLKQEFNAVSDFLIALGDPKRQQIIITLMQDHACQGLRVIDLIDSTQLSRPAISHHLKILKQVGLIDVRSEGTKNYYFLVQDTTPIQQLQRLLTHITTLIQENHAHD